MKKASIPLIVLMLLGVAAFAQKSTRAAPGTFKLGELKIVGTDKYTDKQILQASGLNLGQTVNEADFKYAAQILGDSGFFADVSYSFEYSGNAAKLTFQLKDEADDQFVPATFDNFVWFKDSELFAELQKRHPLFREQIPLKGNFADHVSESLQGILDDTQHPGRVDYLRESAQGSDKLIGYTYRVTAVDFLIQDLEFPGASPELAEALAAAGRRVIGTDYSREGLAKVIELDFLPVYHKRGFLQAKFAPSDAKVISQQPNEVQVNAIFQVNPGIVYSTTDFAWTGNKMIPSDQLAPLVHLAAGQPADTVRLASDLVEVRKLYHVHGYMMARVTPHPQMDDAKGTVHFDLDVAEGDQFKMGDIDVTGVDSKTKTRLQDAWGLKEGDPYRGDYAKKFLEGVNHLLPDNQMAVEIQEIVNERDKTVDVTLRFSAR
jgi:outer membrane protein assembly factor BamA